MTTEILGKLSFLQTPDVNGSDIMINAGGVPQILSGTTAARTAAGVSGQLYLDTTLNKWYRDNGTSWDDLSSVPLIDGTANQITVVDGTNVTPTILSIANDPILPGTEAFRPPVGTTAQRNGTPSAGDTRFNSTTGKTEEFSGTFWKSQGQILQIVTGSIGAASGTATVPLDNTIPTMTEGWQIWTNTFTPVSATSKISIRFFITASNSSATITNICSLFAGTLNISSAAARQSVASMPVSLGICCVYSPGSTATITFSARLGGSGNSSSYCNQIGNTTLGGSLVSEYTIMEIE